MSGLLDAGPAEATAAAAARAAARYFFSRGLYGLAVRARYGATGVGGTLMIDNADELFAFSSRQLAPL